MANTGLFTYQYNTSHFEVIAQPIIKNKTQSVHGYELLSRCTSINDIEMFFDDLSPSDVTKIACIQMASIANLAYGNKKVSDAIIHINIHDKTLLNSGFITLIAQLQGIKFAFEIDGFDCNNEYAARLKKSFSTIQLLGHEIWLDDYGTSNTSVELLLLLPWDGIKIDKGITWRSTPEQLIALVTFCKTYSKSVTLEGIEDEYLSHLARRAGSDYSQGYYWK